jgi:hypothetical protein
LNLSRRDKWYGYFQSSSLAFSTVAAIENRIKKIEANDLVLKNSVNNRNSIGVHIRQGDYLNNSVYTHLEFSYYKNALEKILDTQDYDQIMVYSDSPLESNHIATRLQREFRDVEFYESSGKSDFVTLLEMSAHSGLVLANSTFSWWAAALQSDVIKTVVRPRWYFQNRSLNADFYPKCWIIAD